MKPKLKPADRYVYDSLKALPADTKLQIGDQVVTFKGMTGHLVTIKIGRKNMNFPAGHPTLLKITGYAK